MKLFVATFLSSFWLHEQGNIRPFCKFYYLNYLNILICIRYEVTERDREGGGGGGAKQKASVYIYGLSIKVVGTSTYVRCLSRQPSLVVGLYLSRG